MVKTTFKHAPNTTSEFYLSVRPVIFLMKIYGFFPIIPPNKFKKINLIIYFIKKSYILLLALFYCLAIGTTLLSLDPAFYASQNATRADTLIFIGLNTCSISYFSITVLLISLTVIQPQKYLKFYSIIDSIDNDFKAITTSFNYKKRFWTYTCVILFSIISLVFMLSFSILSSETHTSIEVLQSFSVTFLLYSYSAQIIMINTHVFELSLRFSALNKAIQW